MEHFNIPARVRKLSPKERRQIVEGLLACPHVSNRSDREEIVGDLDGISQAIIRHESDTADVMSIVRICSQYPNGLKKLVEAVAFLEKNSIPMQKLEQLLASIFFEPHPQIISQELFGELLEIITEVQVDKSDLIRMYGDSVPDGWQFPEVGNKDEVDILAFIVRDLTQTDPKGKGTWPLLKFVELLAKHTEQSIQNELAHWREEAAKAVGIEEQNAPRKETSLITTSLEDTFHLLLKLTPNCNKPEEEIIIQAWFLREQNEKVVEYLELKPDHVLYHLGTTPTFLDSWINRCVDKACQFTIELFLPFELLNHDSCDAHQWHFNAGFNETSFIAHEYPLILRSSERAYIQKAQPRRKWEVNWTKGKVSQEPTVLREKDYIQYADKEDFLIVQLEEAACVAITFVPPQYGDKSHIFTKMMTAGTSIALWPRSHDETLNEEALEQVYRDILAGCPFTKLPEMLLKRRREVRESKSSIVNTLTLFWDKPDRLPGDIILLEAPSKKEVKYG